MQAELRITFGTGYDAQGEPVQNAESTLLDIGARVARQFGGYSLRDVQGGWIDDSGKLVQERSKELIVLGDLDSLRAGMKPTAELIRQALNQSSVLVALRPIEYEFVN